MGRSEFLRIWDPSLIEKSLLLVARNFPMPRCTFAQCLGFVATFILLNPLEIVPHNFEERNKLKVMLNKQNVKSMFFWAGFLVGRRTKAS